MSEIVSQPGPPTPPVPVAPSRQCIGCGFDVVGIAMDGVCSECQKPVRETVLRPMLRDDPRRARWALIGAWLILADFASTIVFAALSAASSFGILQGTYNLDHNWTDWIVKFVLLMITNTAVTLLALASRARLPWLVAAFVVGLLPLFITLTNQWLNASPTMPGIRTWMLTSNIVNIMTVAAVYLIYARAVWACSRACDCFALRVHARRLYLAAVIGIPLLTLVPVSMLLFTEIWRTANAGADSVETVIDLLGLAGTITGVPFIVAMFLFGSWVVFRLAKAAKAEATFASTLPP